MTQGAFFGSFDNDDTEQSFYYRSTHDLVYRLHVMHPWREWQEIPALPTNAEVMLMTNGGVWPIVAARIERSEQMGRR